MFRQKGLKSALQVERAEEAVSESPSLQLSSAEGVVRKSRRPTGAEAATTAAAAPSSHDSFLHVADFRRILMQINL